MRGLGEFRAIAAVVALVAGCHHRTPSGIPTDAPGDVDGSDDCGVACDDTFPPLIDFSAGATGDVVFIDSSSSFMFQIAYGWPVDIDGDGIDDVAFASTKAYIWFGRPGFLSPKRTIDVSIEPADVEIVVPDGTYGLFGFPDFDGDGVRDVAISNGWNQVFVVRGQRLLAGPRPLRVDLGVEAPDLIIQETGGAMPGRAVGDVNNDGREDLWQIFDGGQTFVVYGRSLESSTPPIVVDFDAGQYDVAFRQPTPSPWRLGGACDVDGDGSIDFLFTNQTEANPNLAVNAGAIQVFLGVKADGTELSGDVTLGTTVPDMVIYGHREGTQLNGWCYKSTSSNGSVLEITSDADDDGRCEAMAYAEGQLGASVGNLALLETDLSPEFMVHTACEPQSVYPTSPACSGSAWPADIDGDTNVDLLLRRLGNGTDGILFGPFADPRGIDVVVTPPQVVIQWPASSFPEIFLVGDVDGDGRRDLATNPSIGAGSSGELHLLRGRKPPRMP